MTVMSTRARTVVSVGRRESSTTRVRVRPATRATTASTTPVSPSLVGNRQFSRLRMCVCGI